LRGQKPTGSNEYAEYQSDDGTDKSFNALYNKKKRKMEAKITTMP